MTPELIPDSSLEGASPRGSHLFSGTDSSSLTEILREAVKTGLGDSPGSIEKKAESLANLRKLPAVFAAATGGSLSEALSKLEEDLLAPAKKSVWLRALSSPADAVVYFVTGPRANPSALKDAARQLAEFSQLGTGVTWESKTVRNAGDAILMAFGVVGPKPTAGTSPPSFDVLARE